MLAVVGVWFGSIILVSRWLGEDWGPLGNLVGVAAASLAAEFLRSDIRQRAEQHVERIRRITPPASPATLVPDRARLRRALRRAELAILAEVLVGTLMACGSFALAVDETWRLVRAAGIASGGVTATATVTDLTDGFNAGYRVVFAAGDRRVEAVVVPREDPLREPGQRVPVVYDPRSPERAALPDDARWFSGPFPWLAWGLGVVMTVALTRLVGKERRALQAVTRTRLGTATVATVLGVGSLPRDEVSPDVLLRIPSASPQQPDRLLAFGSRQRWRARRLVSGDQVVVYGVPLPGEHVVLHTAGGRILLPRRPLRLSD